MAKKLAVLAIAALLGHACGEAPKSTAHKSTGEQPDAPEDSPLGSLALEPDEVEVVYRVNAGGPALSSTPAWSADTAANPSPYVNAAATGNWTYSTTANISVSDPSIPAGTPQSIFQAERWDPAGGSELQWNFAVPAGNYRVRLYFAEIFYGAQTIGARVFDVWVEGALVLDNYDVYADVGGYKGVVKTFDVAVSDGNLDVDFGHVIENPAIKAVEVVAIESAPPPPPPGSPSFRINVGGPALAATDGGPNWSGDTSASPSIYVNAGNQTYLTTQAVSTGHPSIPAGTPSSLFQSERWDPSGGPEMQWNFPVQAGSYTVRLYFAEIYSGALAVGARKFDVFIEGSLVLDDFDVFAEAGGHAGIVKTFTVTSDGNLDIDFGHVTENPALKGIEIVPAGTSGATPIGFGKSLLAGESSAAPTALEFGPDGRLYAAEIDGAIKAYTVERNGPNSYAVTASETIALIKSIPNHNDDGTLNTQLTSRQITGMTTAGSASYPVLYVTSSDPRIGGGASGDDLNLDTNSSIVSRLTWSGTAWTKLDLVRGLPRSEENHAANGMALDPVNNVLYLAQGGNTNMGATSNNFAYLPEFALSAAILSIDLAAIGDTTYDLPTLNDEDRAGNPDANDPFGGNQGKNQAILVSGGPVQVYAPGFRNPYDVLLTQAGKLYTIDNGPNAGWGDVPKGEGTATCTNAPNEPGVSYGDHLHFISAKGYYGGHPNPTRGYAGNTFNASNPQSPVPFSNSIECDFKAPGAENGALAMFPSSTNGMAEYTASNFGGAMKGDIVTAGYVYNTIYRIKLGSDGASAVLNESLFSTVGKNPLDVDTQGDADVFPGTVWAADLGTGAIVVFEPNDYGQSAPQCEGGYYELLDEDGDGYTNKDEIDNGTNPCSAADVPPDFDGDLVSNLNDPDDDNDGIPDVSDPFARDAANGAATVLPVRYDWEKGHAGGGILDTGFTGLMTNGIADYETLFDPELMTAGGAAGVLTIDQVSDGDAYAAGNNQHYAFQFGMNASPAVTGKFTVGTRIVAPFSGFTPKDYQSMGLFVGTGDQDNYFKLVVTANGGAGGVQWVKETNGLPVIGPMQSVSLSGVNYIDLSLTVDPGAATVQPSYQVTVGGVTQPKVQIGLPIALPSSWFGAGFAVGIISTSLGSASPFAATWDHFEVIPEAAPAPGGVWESRAPTGLKRQEVSYVHLNGKFYLAGGGKAHQVYDPANDTWSNVAPLPKALDHIQGVALNGLIYYIGGLEAFPSPHVNTVYIYDPVTNKFIRGTPMTRGRGAGGVAAHGRKIYYAGGLSNGAAVPWFDVYDPDADTWQSLPDMPLARDHFHAAVLNGRFYAIGGRNTSIDATIAANHAFDFATGNWVTGLAPLPTPRGGFGAVALGGEILVLGGEGGGKTYADVEAYDPASNSWRSLAPMPTARHGIQAATCSGGVYVAAGGTVQGGAGPSDVHEVLFLNGSAECKPAPTTTLECTDEPSVSTALMRWPYPQLVGSGSATIAWATMQGAYTGEVRYGLPGATGSKVVSSKETIYGTYGTYDLHTTTLSGLAADTAYCYEIGGNGLTLGRSLRFKTAPAETGTARFFAFGDPGAGTLEQMAVRDAMAPLMQPGDLWLTTGDNAYPNGTWNQFERYLFDPYRRLMSMTAFYPAPGNHDYNTAGAVPYLGNFVMPANAFRAQDKERYYSFDWGPAHFIALDTQTPLTQISSAAVDDMQDWLAADLAATSKPWKIVYMHVPPYSVHPKGRDDGALVRQHLMPLFEQYGVQLALVAHDHLYARFVPLKGAVESTLADGGVTYVITGGGGAPVYAPKSDPRVAASAGVHHFVHGEIGECSLSLEAVDLNGATIDSTVLDRCP